MKPGVTHLLCIGGIKMEYRFLEPTSPTSTFLRFPLATEETTLAEPSTKREVWNPVLDCSPYKVVINYFIGIISIVSEAIPFQTVVVNCLYDKTTVCYSNSPVLFDLCSILLIYIRADVYQYSAKIQFNKTINEVCCM